MKKLMTLTTFAIVLAGCSAASPSANSSPAAAQTTTAAAATTAVAATIGLSSPTPALSQNGEVWTVDWSLVTAFWSPAVATGADPLVLIHTIPEIDGFFFSLELYTTGYGQLWTGELGEAAVGCTEGPPGANSTGICPYFDSDGPGPVELSSAFVATGSITINKLDDTGYDILVNEIVYPDGTTVGGFAIVGP
jgi:hypothetical protein